MLNHKELFTVLFFGQSTILDTLVVGDKIENFQIYGSQQLLLRKKLQKCSVILLKGNDAFSDNYLANCALQVLQT